MATRTPLAAGKSRPEWLPAEGSFALVEAGRWWDVIAISGELGELAVTYLRRDEQCGPIALAHRSAVARWYGFVPLGTVAGWRVPGSDPLSKGDLIGLPGSPDDVSHAVRWEVPPGLWADAPLIEPSRLRRALAGARHQLTARELAKARARRTHRGGRA